MKVRATEQFKYYRNASLRLPKKDFRDLQAGKEVDVPESKIEEYPKLFEVIRKVPKEVEEVSDGD